MTMTTEELKITARNAVGWTCESCGATPVEFAHVVATKCTGRGRGQDARLRDVIRYPQRYRALCKACHAAFDRERLAALAAADG